ncbi:MAG: RluA family pseudouridine synthase [Flavobacteriales bacterium]|nr:RluA family pseudouridine synthase [Flavobacteriales bacterium]
MSRLTTVQSLEVLFEDNHIIAVNKRAGDIVQGDHTGDIPLSEIVKEWIRKKYNKPGNVFTGVVHRIDRPVSGVVVFAKTSKALSRLNEMFKTKNVTKVYYAAVCHQPKLKKSLLTHFLVKDTKRNKSKALDIPSIGAKKAVLEYQLVMNTDRYSILKVNPHTGRHHQIRVQLSSMGCPIKGDLKYGAPRPNRGGGIHLHAYSIQLMHPVRKEPILIKASFPDDPIWKVLNAKMAP